MQDADASSDVDREIRDSIRVMNQQRTTKKWTVLIGLVVAFAALCAAVYLAYKDDPKAAEKPAPALKR